MVMPPKICALCKLEKEICDSHIVPEFMYQMIYDKSHSFVSVSLDAMDANQRYKKGIREKLLCKECEIKFSKPEGYAADFFYTNKTPPKITGKFSIFENLQYKKLKLFFLSLLWRLAVTSLTEFQGASLGEVHKEKLRVMLLADNPGKPLEYPCFVRNLTHKSLNMAQLIVAPMPGKLHEHRVWEFIIAGFCFTFILSSHLAEGGLSADLFLTENGKMIIKKEELKNVSHWYDYCLEIGNASLKRKQIPKPQMRWRKK
jgi:hypothetical protein